jgi:type II secretory pathway component GspD/PulD (secretin)
MALVCGAFAPMAAADASPLDKRVTVRLKDAPLSTYLDALSAQTGVSFVVAKGLESSKITVFLQDAQLRDALLEPLELEDLSCDRLDQTDTFMVRRRSAMAPRTITRIYPLNYAP